MRVHDDRTGGDARVAGHRARSVEVTVGEATTVEVDDGGQHARSPARAHDVGLDRVAVGPRDREHIDVDAVVRGGVEPRHQRAELRAQGRHVDIGVGGAVRQAIQRGGEFRMDVHMLSLRRLQ
jgi:hypothetical protein